MTKVRIRIDARELEYDGDNAAEFFAIAKLVFGFTGAEPAAAAQVAPEARPDEGPASTEEPPPSPAQPARLRGRGPGMATNLATVACYPSGPAKSPILSIYLPRAATVAAGLAVGTRLRTWFDGATGRIGLAKGDRGPRIAPGRSRMQLQFGGASLDLPRESRPGEECRWTASAGAITIAAPSWWPGRAHKSAPEEPPAPVTFAVVEPSRPTVSVRRPALPAAPKTGERIDGGTLIPVAERECMCHTCATAVATISCDVCDALFCPACWRSHLLTHRRPRPELGRQDVARA